MPEKPTDPAHLEGEALRRWYLRTPDQVEAERQAAAVQRFQAFFGAETSGSGEGASNASQPTKRMLAPDENVLWVANGRGGYRTVRPGADDFQTTLQPEQDVEYPRHLPGNSAAVEGGEIFDIGSRENNTLKKFYIEKYGYWPKTEDGRDYEVSHKRAIADGGKNALDNIEPIHPDDHRPKHVRDGDSSRFGKRSSIARTFGGRVEPWHGGPAVRGFGLLGTLANVPGLLLNPPRTDSLENFATDVLGLPSMGEYRRAWERPRGRYSHCPPGQVCA